MCTHESHYFSVPAATLSPSLPSIPVFLLLGRCRGGRSGSRRNSSHVQVSIINLDCYLRELESSSRWRRGMGRAEFSKKLARNRRSVNVYFQSLIFATNSVLPKFMSELYMSANEIWWMSPCALILFVSISAAAAACWAIKITSNSISGAQILLDLTHTERERDDDWHTTMLDPGTGLEPQLFNRLITWGRLAKKGAVCLSFCAWLRRVEHVRGLQQACEVDPVFLRLWESTQKTRPHTQVSAWVREWVSHSFVCVQGDGTRKVSPMSGPPETFRSCYF